MASVRAMLRQAVTLLASLSVRFALLSLLQSTVLSSPGAATGMAALLSHRPHSPRHVSKGFSAFDASDFSVAFVPDFIPILLVLFSAYVPLTAIIRYPYAYHHISNREHSAYNYPSVVLTYR